jgi:hypothetical protein
MDDALAKDKIDILIARFYSAFDNRKGVRPDVATVTECFTEKATIVRQGSTGAELYTVGEFANPRIELLTHGTLLDFNEWEISSTTQLFNGIAARTSRYSKAGLLNGNEYSGSGTKCFHLVELGAGWRIASLAWVDDNG